MFDSKSKQENESEFRRCVSSVIVSVVCGTYIMLCSSKKRVFKLITAALVDNDVSDINVFLKKIENEEKNH